MKEKNKNQKKNNNSFLTILLVAIFFVGLSVLLYPTISDFWNSKRQSQAIVDYDSLIADIKPEDYSEYFKEADLYNEKMRLLSSPFLNYKSLDNFLEDDSALSWTIYESEGESVKLYKCTKTSETGETEYDCEITYTETCKYRDYRYEVNTVTRYVIMTFAPETHKVASFEAAVNQRSGYVRIDIE